MADLVIGGGPVSLQDAYDDSTSPEIVCDATRLGVQIRDNATPIAADLLLVEDNAGAVRFGVDVNRALLGNNADLLPNTNALRTNTTNVSDLGAAATQFANLFSRRARVCHIDDDGGTATVTFGDGSSYGTQGSIIAGSSIARTASGTATMNMGGGYYPPICLFGNAYMSGTGTATVDHQGGGGMMVGAAFGFSSGDPTIQCSQYAYGCFTAGYVVTRGSGDATIDMRSGSSGSFIWGYINSQSNTVAHSMYCSGGGDFVSGLINGTSASSNHVIGCTSYGAFVQGYARGNNNSRIIGAGQGSFTQGRCNGGSIITASANGAFAQGSASTAGGALQATGAGSFAQGSQSQASTLQATNQGSFAQGRCRDTGSYLQATNIGSFAQGDASAGSIVASAANAHQLGVGTNAVADSLQMGSGFLATASGAHRGVRETVTLAAAVTTFAIGSQSIEVTGDAGTNTIATITGGIAGQFLALQFVDGLVTITDDNTHVADSVDLSAAFTSADDTILFLFYDGTSWYEVARSVN